MAEIKIAKIKLRRGTNSQRKSVILDQGELVGTLDTKRLYMGNGVLSGGDSVSSKIHPSVSNVSSLININAETNDIVRANNTWYQLTGTNSGTLSAWANINTPVSSEFQYIDGTLATKLSGLSASSINPITVSNGLKIQDGVIQSHFNTKSLEISASQLSIKIEGINERELASSTFTNGISGGNNNKVGLRVNPLQFYFSSGVLSLSTIPPNSLTFPALDSSWFGTGLIYDGVNQKIKTNVSSVDNTTLVSDISGKISIKPGLVSQTIYSLLTGNNTTNSNNTLSAIFNGNPKHTLNGAIPGLQITKFTALSTNGVTTTTIELSSAGFVTYLNPSTAINGQTIGRYAIPIFAF